MIGEPTPMAGTRQAISVGYVNTLLKSIVSGINVKKVRVRAKP